MYEITAVEAHNPMLKPRSLPKLIFASLVPSKYPTGNLSDNIDAKRHWQRAAFTCGAPPLLDPHFNCGEHGGRVKPNGNPAIFGSMTVWCSGYAAPRHWLVKN